MLYTRVSWTMRPKACTDGKVTLKSACVIGRNLLLCAALQVKQRGLCKVDVILVLNCRLGRPEASATNGGLT